MKQQPKLLGNGYAISRDLNPKFIPINKLTELGRETRKHSSHQTRKLQGSIEQFGLVLPIVVDGADRVVAGWGLVLAAKRLGLQEIPAITITDLDESRLRTLRLALNRLAEDSQWDHDALTLEFSEILEINPQIDLKISGFEMGEIDVALNDKGTDEEDDLYDTDISTEPRAQFGDLWSIGDHRIFCGNALSAKSYRRLLGEHRAEMVFTDPPWNVRIAGHASGLGAVKHKDFVMASGEMSSAEFQAFLLTAMQHAALNSIDGSLAFYCVDWRHVGELLAAAGEIYTETKNLCVWKKSNAGMGSLYRSQHELIYIFKKGSKPHINNIELGRFGRHRSNIWEYPSQNSMSDTKSKLSLHPTAKPVALIADALRDCSNRGGLVLDGFGGVGTTAVAAEKTGRRARLIEIEPRYVDIAIRRMERLTGGVARKL